MRTRLLAAMASAVLISSLAGTFVPVAAAGPLSITNVDSPDPVQSGAQILYTITVMNTGGASVNNIVLTDQINGVVGFGNPPLLDVVSSQGSCSQTNTQVTCSAGTLGGRGVWTVTIRGNVTAASGTTINNIATVVATKSAQTYTTSAAATTQVQGSGPGGPSPDLTIAKNGPLHVTPDSTITYTLTVNNIGTANALGVKVTDTIPALVTITGVIATSLFSCPAPYTDNTVVCTGGRVNAGASATITVNGTVPPSGLGTLENTSAVDPDDTIDEGILGDTADAAELNNFSNTVVTNVSPNPPNPPPPNTINIDKQGPLSAIPNRLITYTIVVSNGSLGRADYITMTDGTQGLHAASLRVVSAVSTSGTTPICVVAAPTVECTMTRLGTGGTLTVVIEGMVIAPAGSTIINSAAVNANIKNTGYTARDEVQTIINAGIDLSITKSDSPDPVCASSFPPTVPAPTNCKGGLTYTFVVGNSGVNPATNVVVRDPLPPGTTYDDAATDAANALLGLVTCDEIPVRVIRCVIPSLAAGATQTIKIVLAAPPTLGTITNTVTVDPSNAIFESDETNNIAVESTTVATGIDLTIVKDDSPPASPSGFDPIATSGTQTYRITVDNTGTQNVTGIHVRDILPAGTIFLSAEEIDINGALFPGLHGFTCTHDGSATGGVVDCIGGSLLGTADEFYFPPAPGEDKAFIEIKIFARPTVGIMHNEVRVDPLNVIVEYDESDNIEFEDTTVVTGNAPIGSFNQLRITKTQVSPVLPAAVATNGTVTYNLHVVNLGTDPVSAVVVQDFLPTGSRFISAADTDVNTVIGVSDAFLCSHDGSLTGGTITCTGGAFSGSVNTILEDDGTTAVPVARDIRVVMFAPNTPGTYPNISKVDPNNVVPEGNEFDNTSTINTPVGIGGANPFNELSIDKSSSPELESATSSVVIYTIVVSNTGSDPAFNVAVRDTLPAGFVYQSATDSNPGTNAFLCSFDGTSTVNCTGAMVGAGLSRTINITTLATAVPGVWINQAIVDPNNAIPEGDETNNADQDSITVVVGPPPVQYIDLHIEKADNVATHVAPDGTISYELTVSNLGTQPAFNVVVHDPLPPGVTFVSAQDTTTPDAPGDFLCTFGSGVVVCTGGVIDGTPGLIGTIGSTREITVTVRAPVANATILNQAAVDPGNTIPEGDETNNVAFDTTPVQSNIDLSLDKDGPGNASQGQEDDYVITVKNLGTQDATNVVVRDPLPVGLIPLGVTVDDADWSCQVFQNPVNMVECVGTLQNAATDPDGVKITIHVFITQDGGTLDNEACVDPDDDILEFSATPGFNPDGNGNNCKTKITVVAPPVADLSVNKSASPGTVAPGGNLTYTISVANSGTATAQSPVTVSDILPSSVTFVTATATNGWTCSGTTTVTCTDPGGGMAPGASALITIDVTVNTGASAPITNTATVPQDPGDAAASPAIVPEVNLANNTDSVTTNISGSGFDLAISDITDEPDPANREAQLTYTIIAQNNGTAPTTPADAAVVRINMPTGAVGVTIDGAAGTNGFNCGSSTPTSFPFDCVGDLPAGGSTVITVTLTVLIGAPDDLVLTARIDPDAAFTESDEGNNFQIEATTVSGDTCTVSPCIDMVAAEILSSPDGPVGGGASVTYTFGVVNIGDTSTGVGDAHTHFGVTGDFTAASIGALPAGWTCTLFVNLPLNKEWFCDGTLTAGGGAAFTITATSGPIDGTITATGDIDQHDTVSEFNETNNGPISVATTVNVP